MVIFQRYASDPQVTRYLCWPTHRSIADTFAFLQFSEAHWDQWPTGPYLIESLEDARLLGTIGLALESSSRASVGYALARDAWGKAYAHEALRGLLEGTASIGLQELYALCHCQHLISARVLEKCGFKLDGRLTCYTDFPKLGLEERSDVFRYMYTQPLLSSLTLLCDATETDYK